MGLEHVGHADIVRFARARVNLPQEDADDLKGQALRLTKRLENYLEEHPQFELRRVMLSGSLAKGTALQSTSDVDVGCYVSSDSAPHEIGKLIDWLAKKLETAFANLQPEQITRKDYSVSVTFKTTGNEVDVVPILYDGDKQWRGYLYSKDTGDTLLTSIPMHLEFIAKRKQANKTHFSQLVRLIKYWAAIQKREVEGFRFKSFMAELILAHLADRGAALGDYPGALAQFFNFVAADEFATTIAFSDYYNPSSCAKTSDTVRIWDPVNCENNVAKLYDENNKQLIVEAALDAGDAIASASRAVTKSETVRYWQKVFGPSFNA
ncbi:nucleotidyltransferase [Pandoraea terrae]|uniref:Nucleotidyltransferase n=1 Tax=Pandoraea terrae TaxID=1537710 RepID=A0A5E4Z1X4_9BURK|nr:CBASS oligonucleotide cyclase [Pandoraea terrae]VVE55139.1 nucleotidyltransferase [Pandoraea terrae]